SAVADCLHLQLYRDSKDRYKQGQTKASLSLQHFLGVETGFTLDKESNTIAILCQDVTVVLAFDTRERLIQWQVKIANNLGEDQQYLIQIGSAPPKAKIPPGPARLHIQEYRFSLTMGVPPRLIGVWNISQLRRYGVVDNRFCFECGSGCGRLEGVYVLVTDQGEEITKAFKVASEGKLIPRRKQVTRNASCKYQNELRNVNTFYTIILVSTVMESPRRRPSTRSKVDGTENRFSDVLWESAEVNNSSEYGDTVSVSDLAIDGQPNENWNTDSNRCQNCKHNTMPRSLTVSNTPGTGFNPAWIMETTSCEHEMRSASCCNSSVISSDSGCRSRAISPYTMQSLTCMVHDKPAKQLPHPPMAESAQYENYDTPRSIYLNLKEEMNQPNSRMSIASSSDEYYDTPKKIKDNLVMHHVHCQNHPLPDCQQSIISAHCHPPPRCSCHVVQICPCQRVPCVPKPVLVCTCVRDTQSTSVQTGNSFSNGAIYAKVDMLKKSKRKILNEIPDCSPKSTAEMPKEVPNYANMGFAQSLEHYENVKDLRIILDKACTKCQCNNKKKENVNETDDNYLVMNPVGDPEKDTNTPPYLPMKPITSSTKCNCSSEPYNEPVSTQPRSETASPFLRRHDPSSCYATNERRRIAQIRRRSNSMDSGRYLDGLECITERTASSSTHNTLTPNSQSNSVDSLPSEKQETPKKPLPHLKGVFDLEVSRRPSSVPCKSNRDSSSSNDSGVSTGSLKNFGTGFLEFETIITPLSKVRQRSLDAMPLSMPRRSKSSDPLEDLSFRFSKAEVKSSSAEAEVPICPPKKESTKDLSVSSSSGALTIPYIDSISSSSGASDMSDYIETLSLSSYSSSEHDNLRQCHSAVTILRPRSGKEYQKIDRSNLEYGKNKLTGAQHADSPSPGYISSTSSN
ncbi:uncharacterized protein LOC106665056, partial [Cimex lectularius]|uniref:IRS-type PTB domain-containing protein n=1 Tax=Cimex lectularius TaxID=79782 RepID=A0A8I6ST59_CIMLE